jgi:hypothetical protein
LRRRIESYSAVGVLCSGILAIFSESNRLVSGGVAPSFKTVDNLDSVQ